MKDVELPGKTAADLPALNPASMPGRLLPGSGLCGRGPKCQGGAPSGLAIYLHDRPVPFFDSLKDWR
jgi:hypothetical protein